MTFLNICVITHSYHREQIDMLTLFTAAFDDAFVYRYNQTTKQSESRIDVRYIHGPKHRVIHDIVTKDKNLTLPVVAIEQVGIARDADRVVHKHQNIYRPMVNNDNRVGKIPTPIPVTMDVKVSIIAKYKEDIDQIVQNFVSFCNPYFVVSWKIPEEFGLDFIDELRIQIEWSGNASYATPNNMSKEDKYRITADTTFTIKGWIFPPTQNPEGTIYKIDNKFINASLAGRLSVYDNYTALSAKYTESETISISAYPQFTNFYYTNGTTFVPLRESTFIRSDNTNSFLILGKRFSYSNNWYLSSNSNYSYGTYEEIKMDNFPTISAYKLPSEFVFVESDNEALIIIPLNSLSAVNSFTFVTSNSAGWTYWPYNLNII